MQKIKTSLLTTLMISVLLSVTACSVRDDILITDCQPLGDITPICGLQSPEDIAIVPGGQHLLLSELGQIGKVAGSIALFDTDSGDWSRLPITGSVQAAESAIRGDTECVSPPDQRFSPHGTHLAQLDDGRWRYLVVNHGDREAVEIFELLLADKSKPERQQPTIQWRGCVFPKNNTLMNDVVGLANGDIIYSRMYHPDDLFGELRGILGFVSGDVWRWRYEQGLSLLPNTEGSLTNGLELSRDERYLYISQYIDEEVHKYSLDSLAVEGVANIAFADNSAWAADNKLWLTSQKMNLAEMKACSAEPETACAMGFIVWELDTDTMAFEAVFEHSGAPMGAATVAVPFKDKVYIGSFLGDRMITVPKEQFKVL